jgi:hypothetical protein
MFHRRRCEDEDVDAVGFVVLPELVLCRSSMSRQVVKTAVLNVSHVF